MSVEREFKLPIAGVDVVFDEESLIQFCKGDDIILSLDPTDLSTVYGAYRQMQKERIEEETWR